MTTFPIALSQFKSIALDPSSSLTTDRLQVLRNNIQICRDAIVFFTAIADAKGLGGHTGGAYDVVPEVMIALGFMEHDSNILPIFFDEAGHRVAIQYLLSVLRGKNADGKIASLSRI